MAAKVLAGVFGAGAGRSGVRQQRFQPCADGLGRGVCQKHRVVVPRQQLVGARRAGRHDGAAAGRRLEQRRGEALGVLGGQTVGVRFLTVKKPKTLRMLGSYIISWSIRLTTGRAICDPTSGMRMFNRAMVEEFAQNLNYGPEPDTISYLIKNGATVKEVQVEMGERLAGQSYLTFWRSVQYMVKMSISILLIQWFRKRDTETPYPERSL